MAKIKVVQNTFNGGEVSDELIGRFDVGHRSTSVRLMRNFIALPHGPARNRPGFEYVNEVKDSNFEPRLIPFNFSSDQVFAIEFGGGYFRFYRNGGLLMNGAVPYEVANPHAWADIRQVNYDISGNTITMVHPNYPPYELTRVSNLNWTMAAIAFAPKITTPAPPTVVATYTTPGVSVQYFYKVSAISQFGYEESLTGSSSVGVTNDLTIAGNFNTVTWSAVPNAVRYNVYKYQNGVYGFIAQVAVLSFIDDNILADISKSVAINDPVFVGAGNYPSSVGYFQQRRFFGGTTNQPTNVWATKPNHEYNMSYSIPAVGDDALRFRIIGKSNKIQHIAGVQDLIFMTASTEWKVSATGAITIENLDLKQQSQNGVSATKPVPVNHVLIYEQAQGGHIRDMSYKWETQAYESNDLSLLATHLFDNKRTVDMAFSRAPYPILWVVNSDGKLLGMTYSKEQQVVAWHSHDTTPDDRFESCTVITEGDEDSLYVIVRRKYQDGYRRYIERLHIYNMPTLQDAFYVDSALSYSGIPVSVVSGLQHLEGRIVSIIGDGAVMPQKTVVGGQVTLPVPASKITVGLPIISEIETLPVSYQDSTFGTGSVKNINKVYLRMKNSGQVRVGAGRDKLVPLKVRTNEPYGSPPRLISGEHELAILPEYNQDGSIIIRQDEPLPVFITYVNMEVAVGG